MKLSPIEIRDKLEERFSKDSSYQLLIVIANRDILNLETNKDGFMGVIFHVGSYSSPEVARVHQEELSIELGVAVTVVRSGTHFPLYVKNKNTIKYFFDPNRSIEENKKEINGRRERYNNMPSSPAHIRKMLDEIKESLSKIDPSISSEHKEIIRLHYVQKSDELKEMLIKADLNIEALEMQDKTSLTYIIKETYTVASANKTIVDATIARNLALENLKENYNTTLHANYLLEARKRFKARGEEDITELIESYYVHSL